MKQMFVDNLVYVITIYIGVPDIVRVDYNHRPLCAAPHTARLVCPVFALGMNPHLLEPLLGMFVHPLGAMLVAAWSAILGLVGAEEEVSFVVTLCIVDVIAHGLQYTIPV